MPHFWPARDRKNQGRDPTTSTVPTHGAAGVQEMTEQDQREWPTFGDILTELNSLGQLSATLAGGSLANESPWVRETAADIAKSSQPAWRESTDTMLDTKPDVESVDSLALPEELPPAAIDTTALQNPPSGSPTISMEDDQLDISALEPLDPFDSDVEPLPPADDRFEPQTRADDRIEADDQTEALDHIEADEVETVEQTEAAEPVANTTLFDQDLAETSPDAFVGGIDPITGEIDWSGTDWAGDESDVSESVEHGMGELHGGIVFPFTPATEPASTGDAAVDPPAPNFDSVATADAIENDLQDLFELDQVPKENDNVVPLHPSSDDHSDQVVGLDTVFEHDDDYEPLQAWVGIDPADIGPKDPWAHMRPTDEDPKGGFWSGRPKFFGGEERKAKKKLRSETNATQAMTSGEDDQSDRSSNDAHPFPCPSCNTGGDVDLEDTLGKRVHLSCASCGQVWAQPYDGDQSQRSA